ncbi:MAG TPA: ImmA/IrrE family metallo-endopeptidase [Nocardioides sp.]|uniref:ImmA/IrrE family metallo-endopeptidase n=1 Tax=Nocardioides sp. TaxID=35761 RepID=UPI002ED946B9
MNWLTANRLANLAAVKAHNKLGIDTASYPVDVDAAIDAAGLSLMYRPMPGLFGIYMEANHQRGILVNAGLTAANRRHTAAHELGHHELRHRPDPGRECAIDAGTGRTGNVRGQGELEMTAEAFATWFLMPRKSILAALTDMGIARPTSAAEVYLLSLLLGATYRATCRQLVNVRIVNRAEADAWARIQPARLKRDAATGHALNSTFDMDVWSLLGTGALNVRATVDDLLILGEADATLAAELPGLSRVATHAGATVFRCESAAGPHVLVDATAGRATRITVLDRPLGIYVPGGQSINASTSTELVQ